MARKTVYFNTGASCAVTIEVPDDADENQIIALAYEELSSGVCAQCSGWGQNWNIDLGDWEPDNDPIFDD